MEQLPKVLGNEMLWILFFSFNVKVRFCGFQ
jgi:hypothetical protein